MTVAAKLMLMTGATGFVGSHALRELAKRDCKVRLVVRAGTKIRIPQTDVLEDVVETTDMWAESPDWWAKTCRGVDTVVHIAWYAEPGQYLQSPKNMECLAGTLFLAAGAERATVRRFVGIGTCFEYDLKAGLMSIDTPLRPSTPYAAAKAAAFIALSHTLPQQGLEFAWCRLFYLYGDGEDKRRLVGHLRAKLAAGETAELSSGRQIRDFLDVRDAARMIIDAALDTIQGPINICSGRPISVRELAERIADEYGRRDLLRFGARPDNLTDPAKVVGVPNYRKTPASLVNTR